MSDVEAGTSFEARGRRSPMLTKRASFARLSMLKRALTIFAVGGFGIFSWLTVPRGNVRAGAAAITTAPTGGAATGAAVPQQGVSGGAPSQQGTTRSGPSSGDQSQGSQSQGGFFNQGGGGYGFGSAQSGPVTGSGAS